MTITIHKLENPPTTGRDLNTILVNMIMICYESILYVHVCHHASSTNYMTKWLYSRRQNCGNEKQIARRRYRKRCGPEKISNRADETDQDRSMSKIQLEKKRNNENSKKITIKERDKCLQKPLIHYAISVLEIPLFGF